MMIYPEKQISVNGVYALIDCQRPPDFRFDGESHPFWEMVYVKEGKAGVSADERIYNLSKGDIIFHKPMEFHRIWSLDGTSPELYIITFEASGKMSKSLENLTTRLDAGSYKMLEKAVDKGKRAFKLLDGGGIVSINDQALSQEYCNYLELFLLSLLRKNLEETLPADSSADSRLFSEMVLYLRENLQEKMSIEKLADRFFVSPSRIKKLFSKYSGLGIMAYFNNMKILEAQKLLKDGYSAGETAEKLGFSNQFYFCTVFKKISGVTPTEFRKNNRHFL